jgi:hypothetical protein
MTGMKLPNLAGRGERLQADYTYGTKKSSSFNIGLFKPLRGIFRSNLSGGPETAVHNVVLVFPYPDQEIRPEARAFQKYFRNIRNSSIIYKTRHN